MELTMQKIFSLFLLPFFFLTSIANGFTPPPTDFSLEDQTTQVIQQYGITWNFSDPVKYGQFVNGDYWIIDDGEGVTVSTVSPAFQDGKNGSMINPIPRGKQGFDIGARNFDSQLVASFPLQLKVGDALLSSVSRIPEDKVDLAGNGLGDHHFLKTVAVLTVLATPPPVGSLRPSYCDRDQKLYNIKNINENILPQLHPPIAPKDPSTYERYFQRPWILFGDDWNGRSIHPYDNMPGYHRVVGKMLSDTCMFLMTDSNDKKSTIINFIQTGIDYYYTKAADTSTWLWPVVFTGLLLNEESLYNYWIENPSLIPRTREGDKLYYIGERATTRKSSIIGEGKTWVDWKTPEGKYVAFAKQAGQEHEHLHPSEWTDLDRKNEAYRANLDVDPWIGMHLSSMLTAKASSINVREKFNRPQAWDYSDRWMKDGFTTEKYADTEKTYLEVMNATGFTPYQTYNSSGFEWINAMWKAYR